MRARRPDVVWSARGAPGGRGDRRRARRCERARRRDDESHDRGGRRGPLGRPPTEERPPLAVEGPATRPRGPHRAASGCSRRNSATFAVHAFTASARSRMPASNASARARSRGSSSGRPRARPRPARHGDGLHERFLGRDRLQDDGLGCAAARGILLHEGVQAIGPDRHRMRADSSPRLPSGAGVARVVGSRVVASVARSRKSRSGRAPRASAARRATPPAPVRTARPPTRPGRRSARARTG